ncbi:hypothetical protein CVT25_001773 [Psilocybe cyanescens]|uniref:tRNA (adenine(58)-N(1))-methyltransferase catalytic subunit TRM61 n=1 Tax=Psilocybe cyanescens TaxID=93625 RepID=A0A409WPL9_PSICY|nr:hypothetical protein CVT25_001773 [Psilocybe cyanescens]
MWSDARQVAAGDTVIIWLTRDQVQPLVITPGKDFNTKFGNFRQQDFIGVPYGSKVPSRTGRGFIHILRPTPELWTIALPHRTQILYLADIAFITSHLNIRHGSKVIEAGTGSASFSHSVARTIGSSGRLHSYEFHEARYIKAKEEFTRHGMDDVVTLQHRNVCKDGFTVVDEVDSVFLDLPAPWEAVEHAKRALRKDRVTRICCFSPCMEQVLRTVSALNEAGFTDITMYETLLRPIEVFQTPALQSIAGVSEKLKKSEVKREEKRLRQIAANKAAAAALAGAKRKRDDDGEVGDGDGAVAEDGPDEGDATAASTHASTHASKKIKTSDTTTTTIIKEEDTTTTDALADDDVEMDVTASLLVPSTSTSTPTPTPMLQPNPSRNPKAEAEAGDGEGEGEKDGDGEGAPIPIPKINVSKALPEVRGHTSYLTFACLVPNLLPNTTATTKTTNLAAADPSSVEHPKSASAEEPI